MTDTDVTLPDSLRLCREGDRGDVAVLTIDRPRKRNALDDATVLGLGAFFDSPPSWARAAVLHGEGDHFCAGLDLGELRERDQLQALQHSRMWHRAFASLDRGSIPVVSVLTGAVIGGGLELAAATHVRVVEPSAFFALPEGQHGLFVGGGGSVRLPRLIGTARMVDMMLTGRVHRAEDAECLGLAQYAVQPGEGLDRALELAGKAAAIAPMTAFGVLQALPAIADADRETGLMMEALMAAASSSSPEAQERMADFLAGRGGRVRSDEAPR